VRRGGGHEQQQEGEDERAHHGYDPAGCRMERSPP
jgi:hypothetical protein